MTRFVVIFLLTMTMSPNLRAQNCKVKIREGINPLNDSACWVIGKKDYFELIVDKNSPDKSWIALSIDFNPAMLSAMIGDSAWIILDNGYTIKLRNCKNFHSKKVADKTLYVVTEYFVIKFLSEIKSEDIKNVSIHKISKISMNLDSDFNLNHRITNVGEQFYPRRVVTYTLVDDHVAVRIKKAGYFFPKKLSVRIAKCAENYTR